MRTAARVGGLIGLFALATVVPSAGQTISAPTQIPANTNPPATTAPASPYTAPPSTFAQPGSAPAANGGATTAPGSTFAPNIGGATTAPSSTFAPNAGGAMTAPGSPYAPPTYGNTGPSAALQGTITPWDPYATPDSQLPPIYPQEPGYGQFAVPAAGPAAMRALKEIGVEYLWMAGQSSSELGINDVDLYATFTVPFFYNAQAPILVTPGFGVHYWNGPKSGGYDLPPRTYDAYLDLAWQTPVTQRFGGELGFRIGVYSDFDTVTMDSLRYQGRGLAVVTLSNAFQVKFGVWYLDRNAVKILPAGGVIWTPNDSVRFEFLFPNPKLAQRLTTFGTTEWWWYVRGEYGGGAWTVRRDPAGPAAGAYDQIDYNDIRVALGLEFDAQSGMQGHIEFGLAFDREIYYVSRNPGPYFKPNEAFFIGAGLSY